MITVELTAPDTDLEQARRLNMEHSDDGALEVERAVIKFIHGNADINDVLETASEYDIVMGDNIIDGFKQAKNETKQLSHDIVERMRMIQYYIVGMEEVETQRVELVRDELIQKGAGVTVGVAVKNSDFSK